MFPTRIVFFGSRCEAPCARRPSGGPGAGHRSHSSDVSRRAREAYAFGILHAMTSSNEPASLAGVEPALHAALARLRREHDVRYAEVRVVAYTTERLRVRDLRPEDIAT